MTNPRPRILLVDDEQAVLDAMTRLFRKDYDIATARNGLQGLDILKTDSPFAVVIADLHMPGMPGLEFLRHARNEAPGTIRLVLTGDDDLEIGLDAIENGLVAQYLCKPCPDYALRAAVDESLATSSGARDGES